MVAQNSSDNSGGWCMSDNNAKAYFQPLPPADSFNKNRLEGFYKEQEPSSGVVGESSRPNNLNADQWGNITAKFSKNESYKANTYNQNRLSGDKSQQFDEPFPSAGAKPVIAENIPFPHKKYAERIQKAGQSVQYLSSVAILIGNNPAVWNFMYVELNSMINVLNYRPLNVQEQNRLSEIERLIYIAMNNLPQNAPPMQPDVGGLRFVPDGLPEPPPDDGGPPPNGGLQYFPGPIHDGVANRWPFAQGQVEIPNDVPLAPGRVEIPNDVPLVPVPPPAIDFEGDEENSNEIEIVNSNLPPHGDIVAIPSNVYDVADVYDDGINKKYSSPKRQANIGVPKQEEEKVPNYDAYSEIVKEMQTPISANKPGLSAFQINFYRKKFLYQFNYKDDEVPKGKEKFLKYLLDKIKTDEEVKQYLDIIIDDYRTRPSVARSRITPDEENMRELAMSPGEYSRSVLAPDALITREKAYPRGQFLLPDPVAIGLLGENIDENQSSLDVGSLPTAELTKEQIKNALLFAVKISPQKVKAHLAREFSQHTPVKSSIPQTTPPKKNPESLAKSFDNILASQKKPKQQPKTQPSPIVHRVASAILKRSPFNDDVYRGF